METSKPWWKTGVIYHIYPRSFQDTNGDGVGDLEGIRRRLDYIEELGAAGVWVSPFYPSPMYDFGYDIRDYRNVDPLFGTLDDFDRLVADMHARNLRLILDLVPDHTSHEHPWFVESRSSLDNPKRDWYVWADPAPDGGPPNNWLAAFGGRSWTFDGQTGQYYLHTFLPQMPDLNYHNPEVVEAMRDVMRFWLDRGVDGFRVDVINRLVKDKQLRDEPPVKDPSKLPPRLQTPFYQMDHIYTCNLPETHAVVRLFRETLDEYPDRVLMCETHGTYEEIAAYYGADDECHLPFNFHPLLSHPWSAKTIREIVDGFEAVLPDFATPCYVLGNHDQHRMASRLGAEQARIGMMWLMTSRCAPTIYYGDEIGMVDVEIDAGRACDPTGKRMPEYVGVVGRDPGRTPMQWDDGPNAGFCPAGFEPWLPVAPDADERNVERLKQQPQSMLALFRALMDVRSAEPSLHEGRYESVETNADDVYAYRRSAAGSASFLVALNFSGETQAVRLGVVERAAEIVVGTGMNRTGKVDLRALELGPHEGLLMRIP